MRYITSLFLVMALIFTMSACGSGGEGAQAESPMKSGEKPAKGSSHGGGTTSSGGKKTIVFSTFFEDSDLKEAKRKYEAMHPDIEIKLEYVETDDRNGEANMEKFIKTMNTELLSGKGPDLIEMDLLPIGDYVHKNALVNLKEMMDQDPSFKKEQYFTNILDHVKLDGGIYGLPVQFFVYGLLGDEEELKQAGVDFDDTIWTWSQFGEAAKALTAKTGKYALLSDPEYLLNQLVKDRYGDYVDPVKRQAFFDTGAFTDLMHEVKAMFDDKVAVSEPMRTFFRMDSVVSAADYIVTPKEFSPHGKLYWKPNAEGQTGGYFRTYKTIGLNRNSSVQTEAWDFMKFLISEEMQIAPDHAGFPLNKAVFEQQVKELVKRGSVKAYELGPLKGKAIEVTAADLEDLEALIAGATHVVEFKPSKIEQIIVEDSAAFFKEQKSAEEVAKLIQNRVMTYLNE